MEDQPPKESDKSPQKEVRPWDFLNPSTEYLSDLESSKRLEICKACPDLIPVINQCIRCGCFMNLKTKLKAASCPIEKW